MQDNINLIAERIRGLRQILDLSEEEVAIACDVTVAEYAVLESGKKDFSFTFLFKCANKFGVDITEIISGDTPKLSYYSVVRKEKGLPIKRREGFKYLHLGYLFKNRKAEPFTVFAKYNAADLEKPVPLSSHKGQELDYILKGKLKFCIEGHTEILEKGDAVYYDSGKQHGMVAAEKGGCEFLAIVFKE